jgi:hypothetical protein
MRIGVVVAASAIVATVLLCAIAFNLTEKSSHSLLLQEQIRAARHGGAARHARLQSLDDDTETDANAVDFGEDSGVSEAIDSSKDDISSIKAMAGTMDDGGNPLKVKLQKLVKKVKAFQQEEEEFYKAIDAPAKVDIQVSQGIPGKAGPTGYRGREGAQGSPGVPGVVGPVGAKGETGLEGPQVEI